MERSWPAGLLSATRYRAGQPNVRLRTHPSSVLWRVSTPWVVFYQAQQGESGWYDMQARLMLAAKQGLPAWVCFCISPLYA